jgi:hypothetical protein
MMPREAKLQCCVCERLIRKDDRKYSVVASLLLRVYAVVKTEMRMKMGDYLCKSCRNKYDRWRRSMSDDFNQLDLSSENDFDNLDDESAVRIFLHSVQIFCCFEADGNRCCCCCDSSCNRT